MINKHAKTTIMKKFIFILTLIFQSSLMLNAQDCMRDVSLLHESVKIKNFADAEPIFKQLLKDCPQAHHSIYINGEKIYNYKLENAKDASEKESIVKAMNELLVKYNANFPDRIAGISYRKALNLFENNVGTKDEVYALLEDAVKNDLENTTNGKALYLYFEMFVDKFEAGNNSNLEDVFELYDVLSEKIELESVALTEELDELLTLEETQELTSRQENSKNRCTINLEAYESILASMDAKVEKLSTCERIIPMLEEKFEENKTNEEWLRRAATRLYRKECMDSQLFTKIADQLYNLNPTPSAAYNKALNTLKSGDRNKALEYFNQAISLSKDNNFKAKVNLTIAQRVFGMSNKSQARAYCEKALAISPSLEGAHLYIASLYAASVNEAATDPFEKRAVYWLAAQTAKKAGTSKGNQAAASYDQRAPSRPDIHGSGKGGQQICFKGWIGKCVTVPIL